MRKIVGVDLFCGAGGVTLGMRTAGIDVRLGIDKNNGFQKTYEFNNPGARFLAADITKITGNELLALIDLKSDEEFVLSSCAPCQPFSTQNRKNVLRGYEDDRSNLLSHVSRIIEELKRKPDYIFIENVPGVNDGGHLVFDRFHDVLYRLKYTCVSGVVDAADYGVPQHRKRFIFMGKKETTHMSLPDSTHGHNKESYKTVGNFIKDLPAIQAGEKSEVIPNHTCRNLSDLNLRRIRSVPKDGGSRNSFAKELVLKCHKNKYLGHKDVYGRLAWDKPAPTITTKCVCLSNGRFGHPTQDRAISVREAARLQTFPDSYVFFGTGISSQAAQVGNAVPVHLATVFVRHLIGK
ncbi:MAG: DNA cytosine methyltransferase [Elusimicrobiales bacterium]|nr:DNA cytosine methyltransferase [Elusimicrobiales bacterium]